MKTTLNRLRSSLGKFSALGVIASLGLAIPAPANVKNATSDSGRSTASAASADATQVRVTRASTYLGADVTSSDGRKVGDIVDYMFDTEGSPHLAYVLVMTGGFLDLGGDVRAIPAAAISKNGDGAKIGQSSAEFWSVPVLPEDRQRFLSDPDNSRLLAQRFGIGEANAAKGRANAPTGRTPAMGSERQLVSFSQLRNTDAYASDGARLGFIVDAWINLDRNRAPYVEVTGTYQPFRTNYDTRFAIPTKKIEARDGLRGYELSISEKEFEKAQPVSETEGVRMLETEQFGDTVLRVTVAQL